MTETQEIKINRYQRFKEKAKDLLQKIVEGMGQTNSVQLNVQLYEIYDWVYAVAPTKERKLALLGICSIIAHSACKQVGLIPKLGKLGQFAGFDKEEFLRRIKHGEFEIYNAIGGREKKRGMCDLLRLYWPKAVNSENTVRLLRQNLEALGCFAIVDNEVGQGPRQKPARLVDVDIYRILLVAYCCEQQLREQFGQGFITEIPTHKGYLLFWLWKEIFPRYFRWRSPVEHFPNFIDDEEYWLKYQKVACPLRIPPVSREQQQQNEEQERFLQVPSWAWEMGEKAVSWWNEAMTKIPKIWEIAPEWALNEILPF